MRVSGGWPVLRASSNFGIWINIHTQLTNMGLPSLLTLLNLWRLIFFYVCQLSHIPTLGPIDSKTKHKLPLSLRQGHSFFCVRSFLLYYQNYSDEANWPERLWHRISSIILPHVKQLFGIIMNRLLEPALTLHHEKKFSQHNLSANLYLSFNRLICISFIYSNTTFTSMWVSHVY